MYVCTSITSNGMPLGLKRLGQGIVAALCHRHNCYWALQLYVSTCCLQLQRKRGLYVADQEASTGGEALSWVAHACKVLRMGQQGCRGAANGAAGGRIAAKGAAGYRTAMLGGCKHVRPVAKLCHTHYCYRLCMYVVGATGSWCIGTRTSRPRLRFARWG